MNPVDSPKLLGLKPTLLTPGEVDFSFLHFFLIEREMLVAAAISSSDILDQMQLADICGPALECYTHGEPLHSSFGCSLHCSYLKGPLRNSSCFESHM